VEEEGAEEEEEEESQRSRACWPASSELPTMEAATEESSRPLACT
jgi:hypothetical protein